MATSTTSSAPGGTHLDECDLVMKGGITSGVVYPAAISELCNTYAFKSIGGSSAGAIAAAATAAAQLGESRGAGGFAGLQRISGQLTVPGALQRLFAPTKAARPAFHLLLRLQRAEGRTRKAFAAVGGLAKRLWAYVAVATLLALLLLSALVNQFHATGRPTVLGGVLLAALVLFFAILGLAVGIVIRATTLVTRHLPQSFFGICTGMPTDPKNTDPAAGLTPWLHEKLQGLSGEATPLTFRHLKEGRGEGREITLTVMTTDVSRARPLQLPQGLGDYCFLPADFRRLFPEEVVEAMVHESTVVEVAGKPTELRRLNDPLDLPVLVATRMSLSFPVLLSAVPLHTVKDDKIHRHWLSDGGISSNFPIHLFDSWLPRRPTLALSFLPAEMADDATPVRPCDKTPPVPPHAPTTSLGGFLSQILDTMQNWRDTLQSELPGFRDRVEVVRLEGDEGGMNLSMPPAVIEALVQKGKNAGRNLGTFPDKWERHRFHRFQTTMSLLEHELGPRGSFRTGSADALLAQLGGGSWPKGCLCKEELEEGRPNWWGPAAAAQARVLRELAGRWAGVGPVAGEPTSQPVPSVSFKRRVEPGPPSVLRRTPRV